MSNIGLSTDLVLANTTTRPGTLVLPLTSQIPGRTITIKDSAGACGISTCFISTSGGETFEDGSTTQALTTSYGFIKVSARAGKWYTGETTQPVSYTASTIRATTTQATSISTAAMNVSSLSLGSTNAFYASSSLAYWGPYLLNSGFRTAQPQVFFIQPPFVSNGLVNRWIFNNGSGSIVTDTVGGQNISLSGTYTWSSSVPNTAIALKSLSFDGYTGAGSAAVNATLQTTTYSVSMWYYHTGISDPRGGNPIIIESGLNQNEAFAIATGGFTGTSQPYFYSSVYNGGFYRGFSSATPLNTWTHLAVTIGNSRYNGYKNGVLDSGNTNISITSGLPFTLNGSFVFGKGDNAYGDQFGGSIFDVRIYNRVLSASEVSQIYNGTG